MGWETLYNNVPASSKTESSWVGQCSVIECSRNVAIPLETVPPVIWGIHEMGYHCRNILQKTFCQFFSTKPEGFKVLFPSHRINLIMYNERGLMEHK